MRRAALLSIFLLAAPAAAQDSGLTGAQVLTRCQASDANETAWCVGFTFGIAMVIADPTIDTKYRACFPQEFNSEAARLVVVRALETQPQLQSLSGAHAAWYALNKAFPCSS